LAANNEKQSVDGLRKNEKLASFLRDFRQKLSAFFNGPVIGTNDLVGLDIGPDRIILLKIDATTSPPQLIAYDSTPLPSGSIVKDEIKNPAAIAAVLRDMLKRTGTTAKYAAVAIPRALAIIKNISVDKRLTADDIESRAWIEANRLFPDLVGNIYLDFSVNAPTAQMPDQMDLLLVACRKEHIKPYLEIVQQGGLIPKIIDVNCYALERALELVKQETDGAKTVALLNVNLTQSSMIVVHHGQLIHAHDQTFDGQRLLKQVDEFVKNKQAQAGMENAPIVATDASYHALLQEHFLSHLRHTVHFFYSSRSNISIDKIILSGDISIIPDFASFIQNEIGVKAVLANPFTEMDINSHLNAEDIIKLSSSMMLCSGLAISGTGEKA
jgi:type IV pilus assembly protein PilM